MDYSKARRGGDKGSSFPGFSGTHPEQQPAIPSPSGLSVSTGATRKPTSNMALKPDSIKSGTQDRAKPKFNTQPEFSRSKLDSKSLSFDSSTTLDSSADIAPSPSDNNTNSTSTQFILDHDMTTQHQKCIPPNSLSKSILSNKKVHFQEPSTGTEKRKRTSFSPTALPPPTRLRVDNFVSTASPSIHKVANLKRPRVILESPSPPRDFVLRPHREDHVSPVKSLSAVREISHTGSAIESHSTVFASAPTSHSVASNRRISSPILCDGTIFQHIMELRKNKNADDKSKAIIDFGLQAFDDDLPELLDTCCERSSAVL
ncbi:hypothetical protein FQR65_LT11926 [Abscondita terminalis]|nr:hypothetical protein FQR65_LT11926 [Abscondita terminalis]